jgi:hypothetical protein
LREKWRDELKLRFGIDAMIVDARTLADEMAYSSGAGAAKAWVASYQAPAPAAQLAPRGANCLDEMPQVGRCLHTCWTSMREDEPLVDLVVF